MMYSRIILTAGVAIVSTAALAQDATYDARSLAMGGVGVAMSDARNASLQNPAALSEANKDAFAFEFPVVAGRAMDPDSLGNNINTLNTSANNLSTALNNFQVVTANVASTPAQISAAALAASTAVAGFNNALWLVSNKALSGGAFVGTSMAVPRSDIAIGLLIDAKAEFGGVFNYAAADQTLMTTLSANLATCAAGGTIVSCQAVNNQLGAGGQVNGLASDFKFRGALTKEIGLSLSSRVAEWSDVNLGLTPKLMRVSTYDVATGAQTGNAKTTLNSNMKEYGSFNFDIGASKSFDMGDKQVLNAGVVVKNMLTKKMTTALGNTVTVAPQMTAGVAYKTTFLTGAADLDLIANKPMLEGVNKDAQYLRLGAEADAFGWAQLRLGYRHDIKGNYPGLPSMGVGMDLFGWHTDLSVAKAGKKEVAASLQMGLHF